MSAHAHDASHAHGGAHSDAYYIRIWVILLVLLIISFLGPMLEIPAITLITAFGIAFVKARLVVKHFMHLDVELPFVRYILIVSLLFMLMFFAATSVDVLNHQGARWQNVAANRAIAAGMIKGDPLAGHGGEHGEAPAHGEAAPAHGAEAPAPEAAPAEGAAAPAEGAAPAAEGAPAEAPAAPAAH